MNRTHGICTVRRSGTPKTTQMTQGTSTGTDRKPSKTGRLSLLSRRDDGSASGSKMIFFEINNRLATLLFSKFFLQREIAMPIRNEPMKVNWLKTLGNRKRYYSAKGHLTKPSFRFLDFGSGACKQESGTKN